jgi:hypothetical protein
VSSDVILASAAPYEFSTDLFGLRVTGNGNVPKYDFWLQSNTSVVYSVFFHQFYEATLVDGALKKYGPSNIALPSLTWEWSTPVEDDTGFHFNITARDAGHGGSTQFSALTFANHFRANASQTVDNSTVLTALLKFDVLIDDYTWVSTDADAKIVLLFDFSSPGLHASHEGDKVTVGDAYLNAATTANAWNTDPSNPVTVPVSVQYANGGAESGVWVIYDHFSASHFAHDPTFGATNIPDDNNHVLVIVLSILGVLVLVAIVAAFFFYRHRLKYQSI